MKADNLTFSSDILDISTTKMTRVSSALENLKISEPNLCGDLESANPNSSFGMSKIADEILQSASFHNHLVAR